MASIFGFTDGDADTLNVETRESRDFLAFRIPPVSENEMDARGVDIPRDHVLELYTALGEWLFPTHTPEWANKSLIEQMIEKAVKDQVAAVLPLHLKPGDRFLVADADGHVWADPEPHDVGHAEEPKQTGPCGAPIPFGALLVDVHDCGHLWAAHRPSVRIDQPTDHGRLMSELPRRMRPRPICVSCGHGWGEHTSGVCWGDDPQVTTGLGCRCTRERPSTASTA